MATPVIESTANTGSTNVVSEFDANLPSGIQSGDLLLMIVGMDAPAAPVSVTFEAGWTELFQEMNTTNQVMAACAYRWADGTEGSTTHLVKSDTRHTAARSYRISGAENPSTALPEYALNLNEPNSSKAVPTLNPTTAPDDFLYIANCGFDRSFATVSTFPATYTDTGLLRSGASGPVTSLGYAAKSTTASSGESPSDYVLSQVEPGMTYIISVAPPSGPPPGETASISDQLGLTESVTANQNAVANLAETVGLNESFLGALTTLVNISEALGINDDLVNQAAAVGLLSNKLGLSENTTGETAGTKVGDTTDILGILSSFTATTAAVASITETMGVVDSPDKQAIYIGQLIEQIGTNDIFNGVAAISALIQENIGLNDQLDADIKTLGELVDIYGASDQYNAQTAAQAAISAINGLSDTVTAIVTTEGAGATSEQIGFSQQLTAIASTIANTQDAIGITDTIVAAIFVSVSISDSMGIQDNFSAIIKKLSAVSDTMGLSDSFSAELAKATVNVAEKLGLLSSYLSNTSAVATLQNNLGLQATFRVFGEGLTGSISAIINLKPSISAGKKQYFYINPKIYIN
jgi:hypothetical protein